MKINPITEGEYCERRKNRLSARGGGVLGRRGRGGGGGAAGARVALMPRCPLTARKEEPETARTS